MPVFVSVDMSGNTENSQAHLEQHDRSNVSPSVQQVPELESPMEVVDSPSEVTVTIGDGGPSGRPCFRFSTKTSNTLMLFLIPISIIVTAYTVLSARKFALEFVLMN